MQKKLKGSIAWGFLISTFITLVIANILWGRHMIDSDYATQLLLSKICSEEKRIITNSWIYGNEIRFINTQIIYGIVFFFTSDWSAVRTTGNAILYLLMLGAYFYMMKPVNIERKYKLIGGGLILLPYSLVALSIIYMSADYLPPVCLMFLVSGAFLRGMKSAGEDDGKSIKYNILVLSIFLLLAGMNGLRSVLVIAGPLALSGVYRLFFHTEKITRNEIYIWAASGISFMIGFGINLFVLMPAYGFGAYNGISFADVGSGIFLENMEACLGALLRALGYTPAPISSLHGLINMVVLCFGALAIYMIGSNLKSRTESFSEGMLKQFLVSSVLFNFLLYGLTDNRMLIPRYVIQVISMLIPVLVICLFQEENKIRKIIFITVIVCFFGIGTIRTYYSLAANDYNADRYASIHFLLENHLKFGYATPWNAGVITELTDGEIEVVNMKDLENGIPMLQTCPRKWFTESYEEPAFLLLTIEEYNEYLGSSVLTRGTLGYEDENFKIFIYQSAEDICDFSLK